MKVLKKLMLAAVFMTCGLAFAQESMTSISTSGLFGTDVDDFTDVNEWGNVKPKAIFGFLGYGETGTGTIQLGLAREFKKFYLGGYLDGKFPTLKREYNSSTKKTEWKTVTNGNIKTKIIAGFGNMGILFNAEYAPTMDNKSSYDEGTKTKITKNKFNLTTDLGFGINLETDSGSIKEYKINALLGLDSKLDKDKTVTNGSITQYHDQSTYDLKLNAGVSFDFYQKAGLTQSFDGAIETTWTIHPTRTGGGHKDTKSYGKWGNKLNIAPKYSLEYAPSEKFAFKTEAGLNLSFEHTKGKNYTIDGGSGTKSYESNRKHESTTEIVPELSLGAIWYAVPSKFNLNFGLKFISPSIKYVHTKTETKNPADGKITSVEKKSTLDFTSTEGKFQATSGFTWNITEAVMLDANWNLIGTLLDTFKTNLNPTANFWETVNKLLIHNVAFSVSVKL